MHIHIPVLTGILMQIIVYFEILFIFIIVFSLFVHFPNVLLHMYICITKLICKFTSKYFTKRIHSNKCIHVKYSQKYV